VPFLPPTLPIHHRGSIVLHSHQSCTGEMTLAPPSSAPLAGTSQALSPEALPPETLAPEADLPPPCSCPMTCGSPPNSSPWCARPTPRRCWSWRRSGRRELTEPEGFLRTGAQTLSGWRTSLCGSAADAKDPGQTQPLDNTARTRAGLPPNPPGASDRWAGPGLQKESRLCSQQTHHLANLAVR
jgi:hypothetical protein